MSQLKRPVSMFIDKLFHKMRRFKALSGDYRRVTSQYKEFRARSADSGRGFDMDWSKRWLITGENTNVTRFSAHYIYHPAWAARIIAKTLPKEHIDISSTLHFCSIVSAFVPIRFYDYRPANIHLSNLFSGKADLTSLPFETSSVQSISCMHTIEHIGLGRYGDPIDPDGDLKSIKELQRVLKPGGTLLFVVPVGKPRIIWNAHRIYSYAQVLSYFNGFDLRDFFLIPDNAAETKPIENASEQDADAQEYGCGCFWFVKK